MKSQQGFTLIEVIVAVALSALVASIGAISIVSMKRMEKIISVKTESLTEKAFAETFIAKILKNAGPSLNLLTIEDDNGSLFFDYIPSSSATQLGTDNAKRTLSLELGKVTSLSILGNLGRADQVMYVDPAQSYTYTYSDSDDDWTAPSFTYKGVNSNSYAGNFFGTDWAPGRLFLLWSPQSHFQVVNGLADLTQAAPSLAFLGKVNETGSDLAATAFTFVRSTDPRNSTVTLTSPDRVFRRVPLVGGSAPILLMRPVEMHRLWLKKDEQNPGAAILMHESSAKGNALVLATNIKRVRFLRSNVSRSIFSIEVCTKEEGSTCSE